MEILELRIGNYICDPNEEIKYHKVEEILKGFDQHLICYGFGMFRTGVDLIEPIPLTEEILLKCGFEINGKYYRSKYIQDSIKLIYDFNQRVLYFKYKGEFSPMIQIPRTIESLHELQNLYYVLTGEELEVHL